MYVILNTVVYTVSMLIFFQKREQSLNQNLLFYIVETLACFDLQEGVCTSRTKKPKISKRRKSSKKKKKSSKKTYDWWIG